MAELDMPSPDAPAPKGSDSPFSSLDTPTDTFGGVLSSEAGKKLSSDLAAEYKTYGESQDKITVQQRRIAEERDAQLKRMMDAEGATAADMHPFNPEAAGARHSHDLWQQFGSPGFVFGMLASAFTGMPMTNALNAGAAAMRAINEGDLEGYHREYDSWKTNTDLAIKRFNMERDAFDQIEHLYKNKLDEWHAQALANAARFDDRKAQLMLENGLYAPLLQAQEQQIKLIEDATRARDQLEDNHIRQQIVHSLITDADGKPKYDLNKNPRILADAKTAADMALTNPKNPEQQAMYELVTSDKYKEASSEDRAKMLIDLQTNFKTRGLQAQEDARKFQIIADSERLKDPGASEDVIIERTQKRLANAKKPDVQPTAKQAQVDRERTVYETDEREKDPQASDATIQDRVNKRVAESHKAVSIRTPKAMYINKFMQEHPEATSDQIKQADAIYTKVQSVARTAGSREFNVAASIAEGQRTAKLALTASDNLPRGDFVPWTEMQNLARRKTSSPELRAFVNANAAFITAYAQTMSRTGQTTVHSQERSEALLVTDEGPEAYAAGVKQLQLEMDAVNDAVREVEENEGLRAKTPATDDGSGFSNFQVVK